MFLAKNDAANGGSENSVANRLRWMLEETMGAQGAFERRRHELSVLRACAKEAVSDADVVESYRSEVDPNKEGDNFMLKYLQQGKLAYIFGSHLFVHGAMSVKNMGTVPGSTRRFRLVHEWVEALNAWCKQEVADFAADPFGGKNGRDRKGSGLMDYGVPGGNLGATVIYDHYLSNGNGKHIAPDVQAYLLRSSITSVISGHQPHGDCPLVIRTGRVTAITADTSYSEMGHKSSWGVDNRGEKAVSELLLYRDGSSEVHGVLADGTGIYYKLPPGGHVPFPPLSTGPEGDVFVGRQLANGFWIKARYIQIIFGFVSTPVRCFERPHARFVDSDAVETRACVFTESNVKKIVHVRVHVPGPLVKVPSMFFVVARASNSRQNEKRCLK
jgi:hypothetical protein